MFIPTSNTGQLNTLFHTFTEFRLIVNRIVARQSTDWLAANAQFSPNANLYNWRFDTQGHWTGCSVGHVFTKVIFQFVCLPIGGGSNPSPVQVLSNQILSNQVLLGEWYPLVLSMQVLFNQVLSGEGVSLPVQGWPPKQRPDQGVPSPSGRGRDQEMTLPFNRQGPDYSPPPPPRTKPGFDLLYATGGTPLVVTQ